MSETRPQFFLVREDNTIIPLIALDELPKEVSIRGVPRNMGVSETRGMTSVGTVPARGVYYIVDGVAITEAKGNSVAMLSFHGKGKGDHHGKKPHGHGATKDKFYCSYWLRTGECDFNQQGCLYHHIMPMDLVTLDSVGLQDIPPWYCKKYNIAPLRPHSRAGHTQSNWRKTRAAPMKSIEYSNGTEKDAAKNKTPESKPVTPETSMVGETVTEPQLSGGTVPMPSFTAGLNSRACTTNGASPITPQNLGRILDFERVGNASFTYKYEAPQTPTGNGPVRSRRLFESQGSNQDCSMSPDTIPSMTNTVDSLSPFSSLGGSPWSRSDQPSVKMYTVAEEDINAADDTLDNLSNELANFDNTEPKYRSISELLDSSLPEDRYGNLILF